MDGKLKENLENAFEDADDALTKGRVGAAAEDAISDLSGSEADEAVGKRRGPIAREARRPGPGSRAVAARRCPAGRPSDPSRRARARRDASRARARRIVPRRARGRGGRGSEGTRAGAVADLLTEGTPKTAAAPETDGARGRGAATAFSIEVRPDAPRA